MRELEDLVPFIERVAGRTETTYVITNNHCRGQAAVNALQLAALLGNGARSIPESLEREFPFLRDLAVQPSTARAPLNGTAGDR